jgi:energy-coupling factor transporter transmembrane protein EcfT
VNAANFIKVVFRVVLVTVLFTILGFALGGLIGVVSISIMRAAHIPIGVQDAIWFGAAPGGLLGCITGLVIITVSERRAMKRSVSAKI